MSKSTDYFICHFESKFNGKQAEQIYKYCRGMRVVGQVRVVLHTDHFIFFEEVCHIKYKTSFLPSTAKAMMIDPQNAGVDVLAVAANGIPFNGTLLELANATNSFVTKGRTVEDTVANVVPFEQRA